MLEINQIYNMDCVDGLKLLANNSIDLVVIDPPYILGTRARYKEKFVEYQQEIINMTNGFDLKILDLILQKLKKINIYIYCSKAQIPILLEYFKDKNCFYELLTWHKTNPPPLHNNTYLSDTEYVLFFRQKGVKIYGNYHTKSKYHISGIMQKAKKRYKHPTIKPLEFIEKHIINSSREGDVILDCFLGSGTTAVACIKNNRRYIGFEIDKNYFEIAKQRIEETKLEMEELK